TPAASAAPEPIRPAAALEDKAAPAATNSVVTPLPYKPSVPRYTSSVADHARSPGNRRGAQGFFAKALQQQRAGLYADAADGYKKATEADGTFFEAFYNWGVAAYENGQMTDALNAYDNALAI